MKAAMMDAPGQMRIGEWGTPRPGPGEVLVAVEAVGICAGDLYFYLGKHPYAVYPQICGHEIAGRIAEVGSGAPGLSIGERVAVEPFVGCGQCYPCRIGKSNCCANLQIIGVHRPGGFAEFVVAPATHVHRVPPSLSAAAASLAEPVAIAVHACRRAEVKAGEYVLVLGCGPIGLALIEAAQSLGAHVVAVSPMSGRAETARSLGVEVLIADDRLVDRVLEQTNGEGAPVVIEATGNLRAMEQTIDLVAAGGRIVIVGLVNQGVNVSLPGLDLTRKEVTILGSRASSHCFPEALHLLETGAVSYARLATEFDLWEAPDVLKAMAANPGMVNKGIFVR